MVKIWTVLNSSSLDLTPYLQFLSSDEKERAKKFRFQGDQANYILGKSILRILVGKYLEQDPKSIEFNYNAYGKPELPDGSGLKFNISHSGDLVLLGFNEIHPIGVDVEKIKIDFDVMEVAANYFSATELRSLRKVPHEDQKRAFYRCWTRKESFIKAKGLGVSFPLDKFSVSIDKDEEAQLIETNWEPNEKDQWQIYSFVPAKNYLAAITASSKLTEISYQFWDSDSFAGNNSILS